MFGSSEMLPADVRSKGEHLQIRTTSFMTTHSNSQHFLVPEDTATEGAYSKSLGVRAACGVVYICTTVRRPN